MLELRQLDLELAFARAGALGKNIENQRGAIEHLAVKDFFQVAALGGREFVIEDDRIDIGLPAVGGEDIGFAFADERGGAGGGHFLDAIAHDLAAGSCGQLRKLGQGIVGIPALLGFKFYSY